MIEVLLFHHAQGLTDGVRAFADRLREAGHTVHTPDVYDGRTFDVLDDGMAYAREIGFQELFERGTRAAEGLPGELVYAGFSLGVMPAQALAQSRPGARGAVLMHGAAPLTEFGTEWPDDVPVQIHAMEGDPWFEGEDLEAAQGIVEAATQGQLFLYPGDQHLFTDSSLPSYNAEAAAMVEQHVLEFLAWC